MTQTISKREETFLQKLHGLTSQQQQVVLDFMEFLQSKNQQEIESKIGEKPQMSAHEAAKKWAGCVDSGIGDLSYNKKYLEGYGE